ncbi:platelet endothelial aggregation receptor 1-like isoform X2 [Pecten maximus]|uniref:platelet endothelial aggregation receptor 1-like isoform X2 n=1 Tax=Pecten maximus TaxID=6579 RepID=UPI0014589F11|nr:platelet endothelial aggregation receptor 1-like isoform X2 [Pecten maximus]
MACVSQEDVQKAGGETHVSQRVILIPSDKTVTRSVIVLVLAVTVEMEAVLYMDARKDGWVTHVVKNVSAKRLDGTVTTTCHCVSHGCDRKSGICAIPGCTAGWTGDKCSQACDSHTFGQDCNRTCHCSSSGCDNRNGNCTIHGCTEGWMGNTCSKGNDILINKHMNITQTTGYNFVLRCFRVN